MVSKAEQITARTLRTIVADLRDGDRIQASEEFSEFQSALEMFIPSVLIDAYPIQWRLESLDAFRFAQACKNGPLEAELIGVCLLISDQTWTPVHIRLRAAPERDEIMWVNCRLGDGGGAGKRMTRLPYHSNKVIQLMDDVSENPERIDWAFAVEKGPMGGGILDCYVLAPERTASLATRFLDKFVPNREETWDPQDPTDVLGIRGGHSLSELLKFLELREYADYTMYLRNTLSVDPTYAILAWCGDGSLILGLSTSGQATALLAELESFVGSPGYCGGEEPPVSSAAGFQDRLARAWNDQ